MSQPKDIANALKNFPISIKSGLEDEYQKAVNKNKDPYGGRIHSYAREWASLMQKNMSEGRSVEDCADETSHHCDYDGITGFMYSTAVSVLSHFWGHGEELRKWHNLKNQIGNEGEKANEEGGVLNTAILSVG
jgi:hypothetical protein